MSGHSTWPEWVYIGVVVALLVWVGAESWNVERLVDHVPADAEVIKVTGQQWFWTFEHPDGTKEIGELHLQKGKPYKFEITSKDVIHSLIFLITLYYKTQYPVELTQFGLYQKIQVNSQFNVGNIVV